MKKNWLSHYCVLMLSTTLFAAGCGKTEPESSTARNSDSTASPSGNRKDAGSAAKVNADANEKQAPAVSSLPFGDMDATAADKGVEPGKILIDAQGQDSSGKKLSLGDYRGKVILLDTWASW